MSQQTFPKNEDPNIFKWETNTYGHFRRINSLGVQYLSKKSNVDTTDALIRIGQKRCIWCKNGLVVAPNSSTQWREDCIKRYAEWKCTVCGFSAKARGTEEVLFREDADLEPSDKDETLSEINGQHSILKRYSINDELNVTVAEVASYLNSNFSDIYMTSPYRVEEIINDIFKRNGFNSLLTKKSRDGGADILLVGKNNDVEGIVEVKRYSKERKIGVNILRSVIGAMVAFSTNRGYIFTTSEFSSDARTLSKDYLRKGFKLTLIDWHQIMDALNLYNEDLVDEDKIKWCFSRRK